MSRVRVMKLTALGVVLLLLLGVARFAMLERGTSSSAGSVDVAPQHELVRDDTVKLLPTAELARQVVPGGEPPPSVEEGALARESMAVPPARLSSSDPFHGGTQFGTVGDIVQSRNYNPGGVKLGRERLEELSELLRSLEADHELLMKEIGRSRDAEIDRRIAAGNYVQQPPVGTGGFRPGPGNIAHVRTDAVLGRIAVSFAPSDVPEVAEAFANRAAFLQEAEYLLKSFFY